MRNVAHLLIRNLYENPCAGQFISEDKRRELEEKYGLVHQDYRVEEPCLVQSEEPPPGLTLKELAVIARGVEELRIRQARENPNAFIEYIFEDKEGLPVQQSWFHREWHDAMSRYDRVMIVAPRNHGKTTQLVGRVIWELGRNPNLRIKIVCASDSKAVERLFEIQQHIEFNERVHKVFPELRAADKGDWTKHKIVVRRRARHRDASVEALGITSTATGGRADLLIADDVVDRRNSLAMPALREAVKHAWFSDWANLMEPDARVFYICTLWHKDDLSHHLLQNSEYTTLAYAVDDKFASLWPEMWPQSRLLQRKREIGSVEFSRAFRNIAQDESEAPVDHTWIRYFDPHLISPRDLAFFLSYDLATGEHVGNDFTASVLFAVDVVRNIIYIVDAWHGKIKTPEQYRRVVRETKRYKCEATLVESVQYQVSIVQMVNENYPTLPVVPIKPKGSKRARLERSTPYMESGNILFSSHLNPDQMKRPERGDLISQLLDFPIALNDDMVDAFSQGVRYIVDNYLDFIDEDEDVETGSGNVSVVGS